MPNIPILNAQITIPANAKVQTDKKSKSKFINIPFMFPDGSPGFLAVIKGVKMAWFPGDEIADIIINFKP